MTARWLRRLVAVVAAVGLAACTATEPDQAPNTPPRTTTSVVPKDRDIRAVYAALQRIDLCAAVERSEVAVTATGPLGCRTDTEPHIVVVLEEAGASSRQARVQRTVGGAKAYVSHDTYCDVLLPVSFELAIKVLGDEPESTGDPCAHTERIATVLATSLADPDSVEIAATWDKCGALYALADEGQQEDVPPGDWDYCQFPEGTPGDQFDVKYGPPPDWADSRETVGRTQVWVSDGEFAGSRNCSVMWSLGQPPTRFAPKGALFLASTSGSDCQRARELAEQMIPVVAEPPSDDVTPQRPLLYRPDEPDIP